MFIAMLVGVVATGVHTSTVKSPVILSHQSLYLPRGADRCLAIAVKSSSIAPLACSPHSSLTARAVEQTNFPMTFFQGATDVKINGGEFTVVNGNYMVFDQSRHTSNVNSFNTTNSTILGSYNDNSQRYCKTFSYTFVNRL